MLSSSLDAILTISKTTLLQKTVLLPHTVSYNLTLFEKHWDLQKQNVIHTIENIGLYIQCVNLLGLAKNTNIWLRNRETKLQNHIIHTAFIRNHMRIVFEEMSSLTPLTMYLGMKTTF